MNKIKEIKEIEQKLASQNWKFIFILLLLRYVKTVESEI